MSARTKVGLNGTTAQVASAGMIASSGAVMNRKRLEFAGITISFSISFRTSANGCRSPR